jgi:thiamine-phosphate pyrophosphorylase
MTGHPLFPYRLYLVLSEAACTQRHFLEVAEEAILGGVDLIQLREKDCDPEAFLDKAQRLKVITDRYGIPLIINDNLEIAMAVDAAGIHVGNNDIAPTLIREHWRDPRKIIGYSIEYIAQLHNEQTAVSDHLGVSPVFSTATKTDTVTEWGLEGIATLRRQTAKPLVAIGNIQLHNARAVLAAGADAIAVVSAICGAAEPRDAASALKNKIMT